MNSKITRLREILNTTDLDGMIIENPINIKYLTNLDTEGILLLTRKENIYITDPRYIETVNKTLTIDDEIIVYNCLNLTAKDYESIFMFCNNVGFEENYVTYAGYQDYKVRYKINNLVETEGIIEKQREIKNPEEINLLHRACIITDECFKYICNFIKIGMTEKEIAFEIEKYMKLHGADGVSFDPIVASGKNSSMPHAVPTDKKIEKGDVITLDFGCSYKGYCSDMTRTIFVSYVPEGIRPIYDLVKKNQENVLAQIREGANVKVLSRMVESDFKVNGYTLDHALGHGVGLEVHELPIVGRRDGYLKSNMVITDEPGIYLPGQFGVRIEDTLLVEKEGYRLLTNSPKDYVVI